MSIFPLWRHQYFWKMEEYGRVWKKYGKIKYIYKIEDGLKHVEPIFLVNSLTIKLSSFFFWVHRSVLSFFLPRNVVLVSVPSLLDPDFAPKVGAGSAQGR